MKTSNNRGLSKSVRESANIALSELLPLWLAEEPRDLKRVVRPTGPGSFSINIEPYRGVRSWSAFDDKLKDRDCLRFLEASILETQPELHGYVFVPGRVQNICDVKRLAAGWYQTAADYSAKGASIDASIQRVLSELDRVLASGRITQEIRTPLSGLRLPVGVEEVLLSENLVVRTMSDEELTDLGSHDVTSGLRHDIVSEFVFSVLIATQEVKLSLPADLSRPIFSEDFQREAQDQLRSVLLALHVLKEGRVGIVASFLSLKPSVLPFSHGQSVSPLVRHPFSAMELREEDVAMFCRIFERLSSNVRDEVQIASARLQDAENRLSPVDSLLDAVIGLEALLNPNDYAELSFRVALNYAFLGQIEDRRNRFEQVRDIQKTRNRVVHGGLNLQSKEAPLIHEHALLAKACLRDALKTFMFDNSLIGNRKLDAEFWLDRVLPPVTLKVARFND